jgi:hypothetical protein
MRLITSMVQQEKNGFSVSGSVTWITMQDKNTPSLPILQHIPKSPMDGSQMYTGKVKQ